MKKITGVIGGGIGSDPFDRKAWSGSSPFFFSEMKKHGLLNRAFGAEVPIIQRSILMAKNYRPDRELWRRLYYMDPAYRAALSKALSTRITSEDMQGCFLQLGAQFSLPGVLNGKAPCYSYHDGNAAQAIKSPVFPKNIPAKVIDRTLAYEREVYHGMTQVFAMSEYLRQSFIHDFDMPEDRVVNIGGGINLDTVPEEIQDKDYSTQEVLFIGVEFGRKGGRNLLEAWKHVVEKLPKACLHIVGPRTLEIPAELAKGVEYHGYLSKQEPAGSAKLEELFRKCCLFVMPSLYEPFGIAPLEAMIHQIPCVVTDGWALKETVVDGVTGKLVSIYGVDDLACALEELLKDPDSLQHMGAASRSRAVNEYSWMKVIQRMTLALGI